MADTFATRTHEKMREVLLDSSAEGPEVHYYMIRGDTEGKNITVWESGKAGDEYIKTYGHYHQGDTDETYWVLLGQGLALLQKRADSEEDPKNSIVEDFKVIHIKQGDTLFVPPYYGHCLINTGPTFLVTADNNAVAGHDSSAGAPAINDYRPIQEMKGFAYYVVEHEGKPALVKNTHYTEIQEEDLGGLEVVE